MALYSVTCRFYTFYAFDKGAGRRDRRLCRWGEMTGLGVPPLLPLHVNKRDFF